MKKIMVGFIMVSLLINTVASAVMGPKRLWQCGTAPDKNKCSESERKEARNWFIGVPAAVIVGALAAVGIIVKSSEVQKMKEQKKEEEQTTQYAARNVYIGAGMEIKDLEERIRQKKGQIKVIELQVKDPKFTGDKVKLWNDKGVLEIEIKDAERQIENLQKKQQTAGARS